MEEKKLSEKLIELAQGMLLAFQGIQQSLDVISSQLDFEEEDEECGECEEECEVEELDESDDYFCCRCGAELEDAA